MKMVILAYNIALDEEIMELMEGAALDFYTKWTKVLGKGRSGGPHLGTPVWPGFNNVLMAAAEDDKVPPLLDGVRDLRRRLGKEGIKAFVLPLEEVT